MHSAKSKSIRHRFRAHFGTLAEIHFKLQTFGIPIQYSPMKPDGSFSNTSVLNWLSTKRKQENENVAARAIIVPRRHDVLFGRGRIRKHVGNLRAVEMVEKHRTEYEKASKHVKTIIAERIVQLIHDSYGRFLKWEEESWTEVSDIEAREKISHFFRRIRSTKTPSDMDDPTSLKTNRSLERV